MAVSTSSRPPYNLSAVGTDPITGQLLVAIVGDVVPTTNLAGQRVLIAFVCIFIAHFAATWGVRSSFPYVLPVLTRSAARVGRHVRDLPDHDPRQGHVHVDRLELAR